MATILSLVDRIRIYSILLPELWDVAGAPGGQMSVTATRFAIGLI